jgi:hypothetical protein
MYNSRLGWPACGLLRIRQHAAWRWPDCLPRRWPDSLPRRWPDSLLGRWPDSLLGRWPDSLLGRWPRQFAERILARHSSGRRLDSQLFGVDGFTEIDDPDLVFVIHTSASVTRSFGNEYANTPAPTRPTARTELRTPTGGSYIPSGETRRKPEYCRLKVMAAFLGFTKGSPTAQIRAIDADRPCKMADRNR